MVRDARRFRLFRLLLAVLQLSLSGVAVVADALQEADAARARVHIEAHTNQSCPVPHGADCPICQFLQSPAAASGGTTALLPPACGERATSWAVLERLGSWTPSSPLARAPPALS
jgi:hypothetical protein